MSSTWASVVPAGTVPKDTTPATSTASLPVLARRVLADPHEIGRFEGIGPDLWELGAASTRASVGREPVTAEDCGSDCGSGVSIGAICLYEGSFALTLHRYNALSPGPARASRAGAGGVARRRGGTAADTYPQRCCTYCTVSSTGRARVRLPLRT